MATISDAVVTIMARMVRPIVCEDRVAHDTYLSVNDMYYMYVESWHVGYWNIDSFMRGVMYSLASTELAVSCNSELWRCE